MGNDNDATPQPYLCCMWKIGAYSGLHWKELCLVSGNWMLKSISSWFQPPLEDALPMPDWHKAPTPPPTGLLRSRESQILLCSHLTFASAAAQDHQSACACVYVSVQYCLPQQCQVPWMTRGATSSFSLLKGYFFLPHSRWGKGCLRLRVCVTQCAARRETWHFSLCSFSRWGEKRRMLGVPGTILVCLFPQCQWVAVTLKPSEIHSKGQTWKHTNKFDPIVSFKLDGRNSLQLPVQMQGKVRPKYWWILPFTINRDLWNALVCPITVGHVFHWSKPPPVSCHCQKYATLHKARMSSTTSEHIHMHIFTSMHVDCCIVIHFCAFSVLHFQSLQTVIMLFSKLNTALLNSLIHFRKLITKALNALFRISWHLW